jgi:hypothetical protein
MKPEGDLSDSLATRLNERRSIMAAEAVVAGRDLPEWVFPGSGPAGRGEGGRFQWPAVSEAERAMNWPPPN